jgi:hypothetical protein
VKQIGPYWNGVMQRLQAEVEQMNQLIAHQGAKGTENELSLARLVENMIPTRFGVGSGLLVDSNGISSKQMDLVVYERGNEPALFAQTNQVLFPVENVRLCIEVKTTLTKSALEDGREKNASIKKLYSSTGAHPPLALLGYGADISATTIANHLDVDTNAYGPRPDMTTSVMLALLVGTLPRRKGWTRAVAGLHQRDTTGNIIAGSEEQPTDAETTEAVRHGVLYPLVAISDAKYVVAEPSRALLLFAEWIVDVLHDVAGDPVISSYIDHATRELITI